MQCVAINNSHSTRLLPPGGCSALLLTTGTPPGCWQEFWRSACLGCAAVRAANATGQRPAALAGGALPRGETPGPGATINRQDNRPSAGESSAILLAPPLDKQWNAHL